MARLSREDWITAAYERFSEDGIAAVGVEPVARRLGATKGSFYWHFDDRSALVQAVLERWRDLETEQLIAEVDALPSSERLTRLFTLIAHRTTERSGERTLYADAAAVHVREPVAAATERRVAYVAGLLREYGIADGEARRRAVVIVSAVIGYQQLVSSGWDPASDPRSLVESLFAIATAPPA